MALSLGAEMDCVEVPSVPSTSRNSKGKRRAAKASRPVERTEQEVGQEEQQTLPGPSRLGPSRDAAVSLEEREQMIFYQKLAIHRAEKALTTEKQALAVMREALDQEKVEINDLRTSILHDIDGQAQEKVVGEMNGIINLLDEHFKCPFVCTLFPSSDHPSR
ncbi:hypothetical protein K488DRAFT_85627 [Vararia minispora EC-137]|uniref:Uncharacterized protein n=1 Tax=Vararia minispora EC-137 TaxID=1314806 RepID=A0ACB8QLE9_9AGAM|nr:hypothetical protein K488DRAFT_85627 [Vararia minispora EC-137]